MTNHHPPRPGRMVLHVGVTGHRDLKETNVQKLKSQIKEVLCQIRLTVTAIYDDDNSPFTTCPPLLRIISPLAEGADRIASREAINQGYELQCPLPFCREEYEKDFYIEREGAVIHDSRQEFFELLNRATAVLELDGSREPGGNPYWSAGQVVLHQSDVLIAIWDGNEPNGIGGTGHVVKEAVKRRIPVICIHPEELNTYYYNGENKEPDWQDKISSQVQQLLRTPQRFVKTGQSEGQTETEPELLWDYLEEKQPRVNFLGFFFKLFRDTVSIRRVATDSGEAETKIKWPHKPVLILPSFDKQISYDWPREHPANSGNGRPLESYNFINKAYRPHFAWADGLANYYANHYRSCFVANYLLGGFAVLFALLAYTLGLGEMKWVTITAELFIIVLILATTWYGRRQHWHDRWIDYRLLAEKVRYMRLLAPLGRVTASLQLPAHHSSGNFDNSWVNWYFRAIVREAGLVEQLIDEHFISAYRTFLENGIKGQIDYHKDNADCSYFVGHRLHKASFIMFVATFFICLAHFFMHSNWLTFFSAVLPAFGAALHGILFQGEFIRLARRSEAMANWLEQLHAELSQNHTLTSEALSEKTEVFAEKMLDEALDWRVVFKTRPLTLPS